MYSMYSCIVIFIKINNNKKIYFYNIYRYDII